MRLAVISGRFICAFLFLSSLFYSGGLRIAFAATTLAPVLPGVYSVPNLPSSEPVVVTGHNLCSSASSGKGEAIASPYGTGILCLSSAGYAYINVEKKFSQSSRSQAVQSGVYGPAKSWPDGRNPKIIVLADARHCVFNPSFNASGAWTGQVDDGRTNRRGITILGSIHQIVCLALSNGDLAEYFPVNGTTSLGGSFPEHRRSPEKRDRLLLNLDEIVIHTIFREDDRMPLSQPAHKLP